MSCSAAQKCIVKEDTIKSLNIEAGGCNTANPQSTKDVQNAAIEDPNNGVTERMQCNFRCQEGYFDKGNGDEILFKCVPNPNRTDQYGIKQPAPTGCQGACGVLYVLNLFIDIFVFRPIGCAGIVSLITPLFYVHLTMFCSTNVYDDKDNDRKS